MTADNAQSHVTAFQPISEAARSWLDDNLTFTQIFHSTFRGSQFRV